MGKDDSVILVNNNELSEHYEVDLLCAFELDSSNYVVYSKNEHDFNGNIIVYCGKIAVIDNKQIIKNIEKDEYVKVKDIIKSLVDYNCEVL